MPEFFETATLWRAWLAKFAAAESELVVGFYKRGSGRPSVSWPEAVDEALCVGWIDGVRKNIDAQSYQIRFTPRKATSTWSAVNIERVDALQRQGRMKPGGLNAFSHRREARSRTYSYEQAEAAELSREEEARFREHEAAWAFFQAQPAGYRHLVVWRVISAKRAETREKRLAKLIEASENGTRL
jgi:uncharacterized protein YdeI (YjbR/CyaY-like superfamily)